MTFILSVSAPNGQSLAIELDNERMIAGSLPSNQIVIHGENVEPIHALFEVDDDQKKWSVVDLGSDQGVYVNKKKIETEIVLNTNDQITLGSVELVFQKVSTPPLPKKKKPEVENNSSDIFEGEVDAEAEAKPLHRRARGDLLFSPRFAKPSGDMLEIVSYWGESILEVEHFHYKKDSKVTMGDPSKTHFLAAGPETISHHVLAELKEDGYVLNLEHSMAARLRKGGAAKEVKNGQFQMGKRDIAHVRYGPIRYFCIYMRPPSLTLPKSGQKDPFLMGLSSAMLAFYVLVSAVILNITPEKKEPEDEDIWTVVHVPEVAKKLVKPPVVIKEIAEKTPKKTTPPPVPKPPVEAKTKKEAEKATPKPEVKVAEKKAEPLKTLTKDKPKPSSQVKKAAKVSNRKNPKRGRQFAGNNKAGGQRKGRQKSSRQGVEGVKNKKASGVNLGKLGAQVGKISSLTGPGAITTKLRSSVGGAGGGSGSGAKTLGLSGSGLGGKTLGIRGNKSIASRFGGGGLGKTSNTLANKNFQGKRRRATVNLRASGPVVSGGLSQGEVMGTIRQNINQIRHCYEQLLQRSPSASGKVKVRFIISPSGSVSSTKVVSSTIRDGGMKNCVKRAVGRWTFPRPRGGSSVTVNYPFVFSPL